MSKSQFAESAAGSIAAEIGRIAWKALMEEVYTTPKPGLVDFYSNGAHKDMDIRTFERSADALREYFTYMAEQGYSLLCTPQELFSAIRKTGMTAEKAMYKATDGVNTHKGLIFTVGIFCAAAGRCLREKAKRLSLRDLIQTEREMVTEILTKEISCINTNNPGSHGEVNLKNYGTLGIRGEAISGYATVVKYAIPTIRSGLKEQKEWNSIKLQTLFVLMSKVEDSNVLSRHDPGILLEVQKEAADFLKKGGAYAEGAVEKLYAMDQTYISRNISSGGCADLLATAIFLIFLLERW
ncbi:MAG: triphosphoribosyl-dephospho-CoA synthase CitG [Hespellia sp.]|nr:triphosphoribosyl-dephospho-CoA synthase CitG [Hespellia sp.]